jgi:probable blue pigment (indigoidine) exporter
MTATPESVAAAPTVPVEGDHRSGRSAYLAVLTPIIFGTSYILTTQFLPPGRPLLIATMRSLPTGIVLVIGSKIPPRGWWLRFVILSVLYCSVFFPLLFVAVYRLPGGVASVINSLTPIIVVVLSVPWLGTRIKPVHIVAGAIGVGGVALLVLRSSAPLDHIGLLAMLACVVMMGFSTVLTKRWGHPPGMSATGFTGWTFLLGGLTLLPFLLAFEGVPSHLTGRNIGGLIYLVAISGIAAYALWFWGLVRLPASSVTFLSLLNPVVAAAIGWVVLHQSLNAPQILGAVLVLVSVVLGQDFPRRQQGRR